MLIRNPSAGAGERVSGGYSSVELLVTAAILGLAVVVSSMTWRVMRGKAEISSAARMAELVIHQARMTSIYEGVSHFVVLDPDGRRLEVYSDTGTTPGSFDSADAWVGGTHFDSAVELVLPSDPSSLASPLDASTVADAWSLPDPDSGARWGTTLKGVMTTPTGLIQSAEATPQTIGNGLIVFSDGDAETAAVGIRGRAGSARAFSWRDGQWKEL